MAAVKIGSRVMTPDGNQGKVIGRQEFGSVDGVKPEDQVCVQWTDARGDTAQNWYEISTVTAQ